MDPLTDLSRLSLNQATLWHTPLPDVVEACARAEIPYIGLWRHSVQETGLAESARLVKEAGLMVSSLCRGGMFPAATAAEREERLKENCRAVDEAVALGTDVLVLVCGGLPEGSRDLGSARRMVADGIARLLPYARKRGVRLGIEPLHPVFGADRSVVVTLAQALELAGRHPAGQVGVIIDVYHVWWDPNLYELIQQAAGRILGFHVNDWLAPPPDVLKGRGMMGDGILQLRRMRHAVDAAGYQGPIEVEIFNEELWQAPPADVLATTKACYLSRL